LFERRVSSLQRRSDGAVVACFSDKLILVVTGSFIVVIGGVEMLSSLHLSVASCATNVDDRARNLSSTSPSATRVSVDVSMVRVTRFRDAA
jgi:hypothetical protein